MAYLDIRTYGDPILRYDCTNIGPSDDNTANLIKDMFETMYRSAGIGLAAPQVGIASNLIVIDPSFGESEKEAIYMINPMIIEHSKSTIESEEGCLSIPGIKAKVLRYDKIKLIYHDLENNKIDMDADGTKSIVLQHEIDHLRGILFIDYIKGLKKTLILRKIKQFSKSYEQ